MNKADLLSERLSNIAITREYPYKAAVTDPALL
jgi:hypothetical protein